LQSWLMVRKPQVVGDFELWRLGDLHVLGPLLRRKDLSEPCRAPEQPGRNDQELLRRGRHLGCHEQTTQVLA
jgi:hypothetical protein